MSFQDLLKQPLPSQMGDDYIMEAANPAKIAADVMDLNKTYKASTKAIKEKIASVRNAMKDSKFKAALNIINNCRKDVINDRNEIGKRVKAIESAGLNKNTIRAIMAGTVIAGGAKLAYDVKKSSDLKKAHDVATSDYMNAQYEYNHVRTETDSAKRNVKSAGEKKQAAFDGLKKIKPELSRLDAEYERIESEWENAEKKIKESNADTEQKKKLISDVKKEYKNKLRDIANKSRELERNQNWLLSDAQDEEFHAKKRLEEASKNEGKAKEHVDRTGAIEKSAAKDINSHTNRAFKTSAAMAAAGAIPYATIKLFMLIKNNYEKYYDGVQKTLDKLEDKCEKQSQNIKECLVDFVNLTYDMEMLMESVESEDDFDESIEFESAYDDFEDDDIEEDIDISDMSDADLDELEDELADSDVEDEMDDDDEEVDLTPEEEREADDLMSLAATTELVRDELSATERAEFYSDQVQAQIAVMEGFMLETDFQDGDMVTEKFYNKTRVQFSKEDRKRQLFAVALNASARAHNDPDYIKLQKVQQMRRVLKARIRKKYRSEAVRRVKVYMQCLKASKSGVLAKIGEKLHREEK